ncbi:hypothetical protein FH972_022043 [Carpinus fangiana]|uniref:Uncharacterized protein n=1 Tax=Carpinus fangiana TaxID=176857 RepID=A0A5N6KRG1_9ROSI|nr:hypothetical protein FH972_022043 [Carpinus fangiana]
MEASTVSVSKSRTAYVVDDASLLGYGHEQDPPAQKQVKQNRFAALLRNAGLKGPLFARRALLKDPREHGKVIISGDWWTAAARCWVHIIPVCVTIVLAYLNLSGFYIGDDLEGWHSKNSESLKRLMLQGAAKLFVSSP